MLCQVIIFLCLFLLTSANDDREWYMKKQLANETGSFLTSRVHVMRLSPNEDLLASLNRYVRVLNISAASIISTVGSLKTTNIRFANQEDGTISIGHFEIVSLVGNLDLQGGHVHISVSDEKGMTIGGHLLEGNFVYTTAEITLLEIVRAEFVRQLDDGPGGSGYNELRVQRKGKAELDDQDHH
jgi:uncharacterized protein